MRRQNVSAGSGSKRAVPASRPGREQSGLAAALGSGRTALDRWVSDGIVLPATAFAERRGVTPGQLAAAVRRGELFSKGIRGRRYYVAALLEVEPAASAAVCRALTGLEDSEKAIFWLRKHGAIGGRTVVEAIRAGDLDRVVQLAAANAAQAQASQRLAGRAKKTKSILDMAGMLKAPEGVHVSVEDMNPWR